MAHDALPQIEFNIKKILDANQTVNLFVGAKAFVQTWRSLVPIGQMPDAPNILQ